MNCEYDGEPLVFDDDGREDACPKCADEIADHLRSCRRCRWAGEAPENMSLLGKEHL